MGISYADKKKQNSDGKLYVPLSNANTGIRKEKCYVGCANLSAVCFIYEVLLAYCFITIFFG